MNSSQDITATPYPHLSPLIAGAFAGLSVDVVLFPLDTLKTRLQSEKGFYKSGGFSGVYRGLSAVVAGAMPSSALFFMSYEAVKAGGADLVSAQYTPVLHMAAASVGEVVSGDTMRQHPTWILYALEIWAVACVVRVPTELAKQRRQAGGAGHSSLGVLVAAYREEGFTRGLYRGFLSTVLRDLPFSFIELPVWELLKAHFRAGNGDGKITGFQSALSGSVAGALAGFATTPLDVAKTRIMLAERAAGDVSALRIVPVLRTVYRQSGVRGLFAGLAPRLAAFTLGGFVFFGAYDYATLALKDLLPS